MELDKEYLDYIADVEKRAEEFYLPPYRIANGVKILPTTYKPGNNVDRLKYHYFFLAVSYDKTICEIILAPEANDVRLEILRMNLADLMIRFKDKELQLVRALDELNKP